MFRLRGSVSPLRAELEASRRSKLLQDWKVDAIGRGAMATFAIGNNYLRTEAQRQLYTVLFVILLRDVGTCPKNTSICQDRLICQDYINLQALSLVKLASSVCVSIATPKILLAHRFRV